MENTRGQKWLIISFFSAIGLFFAYFIISIALDRTDKTYSARLESARRGAGSFVAGDQVNLIKDQSLAVGKLRMTYRGRLKGALHLDLIFTDLDSDYAYTRKIPVKEAKSGFRISDHQFRAKSVSDERLRLVFVK